MVAGIVVSKTAREVDKIFDYKISEALADIICVGAHVLVPFGKNNMLTEGFVVYVKEKTDAKTLKQIHALASPKPLFDEKGFALADYIRESTLCTYAEALHLLIPTGAGVRLETWVQLTEGADVSALKGRQREVADRLSADGGEMELVRLLTCFDTNVRPVVTALEEKGIVLLKQIEGSAIKEKTVRFARLCVEAENLYEVENELKKRAPVQSRMLSVLKYNESVAVCDLVAMTAASYNAVNALKNKGYIEFFDKVIRRTEAADASTETPPPMTAEQQKVYTAVSEAIDAREHKEFLLRGVTGSGKTEVYMRLIERVTARGQGAIVLVPEIALTPLMTGRFTRRFGDAVAILHSGLSLGERYDEWKRIREGEVKVVVGARSAIFAPLSDIGIIILDEEHENAYKSETAPRYHARDVAKFRCAQHGAVALYASATPLVESYYKALHGAYTLLEMPSRYNMGELPCVDIVDMREELKNGNRSMFSSLLREEIEYNRTHGEQTILFLNRRGFSTFVSCRECGYVVTCPHCNISLTYHRYTDRLTCHYCGYTQENYKTCPSCSSSYIRFFGVGTQKVEEALYQEFEGISVVRMDADTTSTKAAHQKLLDKFEHEKSDVLLGTQMVSKGLDFHTVTLVGVLAADAALHIDDYRSSERTFNLITQVAGRAGRGDLRGRAIVQTYSPEHYAIVHAQNHDYVGFYGDEISFRRAMWYPPFCELVTVLVSGTSENLVRRHIRELAKLLHARCDDNQLGRVSILGPVPSGIPKIKDKFRYRMVIKCENAEKLNGVLREMIALHLKDANKKLLSLIIDKNPNSLA